MEDVGDLASIGLLRRLRAGEQVHFVHHVDVCSAAPEDLVAGLEPVPGTTGLADDGYGSVWYLFYAKRFKSKGNATGYRERAIDDGTYWKSEKNPKNVQGSGGGTSCNFSYGRKIEGSGRSIHRLGWCMHEYDDEVAAAAARSNYVLCKLFRTPRGKGKSPASSSSSSTSTSSKNNSSSSSKKRKDAGGDHPEAPPAKLIQQETAASQVDPLIPCYQYQMPQDNSINSAKTLGEEQQELAMQRPGGPGVEAESEQGEDLGDLSFIDADFLQMMQDEQEHGGYGGPVVAQATGFEEDMHGPEMTMYGGGYTEAPPHQEEQVQQQETACYEYQLPQDVNVNLATSGEEKQELSVQQPGGHGVETESSEHGVDLGDFSSVENLEFDDDFPQMLLKKNFLQILQDEQEQGVEQPEQELEDDVLWTWTETTMYGDCRIAN